jgi:hypothetical protein
MLTRDEIRRWAVAKLPGMIEAHYRGENLFPLEVSRFGRADRSDSAAEIDRQIRQLIDGSVEVVCNDVRAYARPRKGVGYSVQLSVVRMRVHREQVLPTRVWFESLEDFLGLLGRQAEWGQLAADVEALALAGPKVAAWARANARQLLHRLTPGRGPALAAALVALEQRPLPGCFAREIALPGISGKFIEEQVQLIAEILQNIASPAWRPGPHAHAQLGLRQTSRLVRLMVLDGAAADYGLPLARFRELPAGTDRLVIVENLRTFLTLPPLPDTVALFGEGYAVQALADTAWLGGTPIHYWGDLDPSGFAILNGLRRNHPQIRSVLMDAVTFEVHRALRAVAVRLKNPTFDLLTEEEAIVARSAQADGLGIEQEKLPVAYAHDVLRHRFADL